MSKRFRHEIAVPTLEEVNVNGLRRPVNRFCRDGARILDTAEGGLVAWRGCSPDAAFVEIVHTAKRHNVGAMTMADDLAQIARTPLGR